MKITFKLNDSTVKLKWFVVHEHDAIPSDREMKTEVYIKGAKTYNNLRSALYVDHFRINTSTSTKQRLNPTEDPSLLSSI